MNATSEHLVIFKKTFCSISAQHFNELFVLTFNL